MNLLNSDKKIELKVNEYSNESRQHQINYNFSEYPGDKMVKKEGEEFDESQEMLTFQQRQAMITDYLYKIKSEYKEYKKLEIRQIAN